MDRDFAPDPRATDRTDPERGPEEVPERATRQKDDRYHVTDREARMLVDVGRFRTVAIDDLVKHRYAGKAAELEADLKSLAAQGLVKKRTALVAKGQLKLDVLVLTKAGRRVAETKRSNHDQELFAGFVKPAEVAHDAAIYRMFHKESDAIQKQGGTVKRVVLDYELKRKIYSPLAKARVQSPHDYEKRQAEVARDNHLKVVNGKIPLPDLRIEYETANCDMSRVDLELATHHYHGSHLREKVEAGFKLYGDSAATHRSPVFEEREITAAILSL